jgi:hypothetical protein
MTIDQVLEAYDRLKGTKRSDAKDEDILSLATNAPQLAIEVRRLRKVIRNLEMTLYGSNSKEFEDA